jgi:hypothetical membrane protein
MPTRLSNKRGLYAKVAGLLLVIGGIQFMLGIMIGESQYPGYSTSANTISDLSGSCPSVDPNNPMQCVGSTVLEKPATIFRITVFAVGMMTAASTYFVQRTLGGRIAPAMLLTTGIATMGVSVFPGNAGIAHGIMAMATFFAGSLAAILSYRILRGSKSMQIISVGLGGIALLVLLSLFVPGQESSPFVTTLGIGGAERLIVYPVVLWLVTLGGYLLAVSALVRTEEGNAT